jgi:hypothetical protein
MPIKVIRFWTDFDKQWDCVEITNTSSMTETGQFLSTTPLRIKDIRPLAGAVGPTFDRQREIWAEIEPHYEAWKLGQELPETGTPLEAWAGVVPEEVAVLKRFDIRTIEALSGMDETVIPKIPLPRLRQKIALAKKYGESITTAHASKRQADADAKIEELQRQIGELMDATRKGKAA